MKRYVITLIVLVMAATVTLAAHATMTSPSFTITRDYWSTSGGIGTSLSFQGIATMAPSSVTNMSQALIPGGRVAKPGDCNNSGSISIDEVQAAINMYLGLKPPSACVDTNNNGISINEVQKVVNGYLGL